MMWQQSRSSRSLTGMSARLSGPPAVVSIFGMEEDRADQVVLTRFNVEIAGGDGRGILPEWLAVRLSLFERVCAPSVLAQQGPLRRWLVFIDTRTPLEARRRIVAAGAPGQVSLLSVEGPLPVEQLQRMVDDAVPARRDFLITTRLDNDDALAADHLAVMRAAARRCEAEFLNPLRGYQVADGRLYATADPSNPFLTLVERRDPARLPLTAFCAQHRRANMTHPVRQVRGPALWVQSVHGANLNNTVSGVRVDVSRLRDRFPFLCEDPRSEDPHRADVHDAAYRRDQLRSLTRAGLTVGRRQVVRGLDQARALVSGVR
jgi:hypothetical protein